MHKPNINKQKFNKQEFLEDKELQKRLEELYLEIGALVQMEKCPMADVLYSIVLFSTPEKVLKQFEKEGDVTNQVAIRLLLQTIDTLLTFVPNWSVEQLILSFKLSLEKWPSPQVQKELKELKAKLSSTEEGEEWKNAE
jgi:hypothetical protein